MATISQEEPSTKILVNSTPLFAKFKIFQTERKCGNWASKNILKVKVRRMDFGFWENLLLNVRKSRRVGDKVRKNKWVTLGRSDMQMINPALSSSEAIVIHPASGTPLHKKSNFSNAVKNAPSNSNFNKRFPVWPEHNDLLIYIFVKIGRKMTKRWRDNFQLRNESTFYAFPTLQEAVKNVIIFCCRTGFLRCNFWPPKLEYGS